MKDPADITPEELAYWEGRSDQKKDDESRIEKLEAALLDFKKQYPLSPWIHKQVDKALGS